VQLPPPCDLGGVEPQSRWNAVSLAYLGDAVWEVRGWGGGEREKGGWEAAADMAVSQLSC
jgi:hypothetical protein